jgi:hypothetical protein
MELTSRSDRIAWGLAGCPVFDVAAGEPYFEASFREAVLLAVERGFVVMRSTPVGLRRSIVTCDVGAGEILLPPHPTRRSSAWWSRA